MFELWWVSGSIILKCNTKMEDTTIRKLAETIIKDFKLNPFFNIKYFYNQILFISQRIKNNPKKFLKKIHLKVV